MARHTRQFTVQRESVDPEAGTFDAVLFTDGEASDGHILNIKGGAIPDRMPLFVNHDADPTKQLGSLHLLRKTDHEVEVRGEIMLDGEGAPLEVRRDLLAKMAAGHVSRMSGRWDAEDKDVKRRVNLPSDHVAFVDEKKADSRKRFGLYFERWTAMEGSIVGLGADPSAVMRFANDQDSPESVRAFWRAQVEDAQLSGILEALRVNVRAALEAGADPEAVASIVRGMPEPELVDQDTEQLDELLERLEAVEDRISAMEEQTPTAVEDTRAENHGDPPEPEGSDGQDEPPPSEVETPGDIARYLREQFSAQRREMQEELHAIIRRARGQR